MEKEVLRQKVGERGVRREKRELLRERYRERGDRGREREKGPIFFVVNVHLAKRLETPSSMIIQSIWFHSNKPFSLFVTDEIS
jgi:hypothetical protein